jgi:enediyne biosynthesis protein E8
LTREPQAPPPRPRPDSHARLRELITRRQAPTRASTAGLAALVAAALPLTAHTQPARAAAPSLTDATLQAFADTILPGRMATTTDLGNPIDPRAIAGADPLPGAVEADALALYHHPEVGFDALAPAFLAELETRSLAHGGDFLDLDFDNRVQTCLAWRDFANPTRLIWEAAAAVPFTAFCAAALIRNATAADASGYRVMGLPGTAPNGYPSYSYRRRLSKERTRRGSLP